MAPLAMVRMFSLAKRISNVLVSCRVFSGVEDMVANTGSLPHSCWKVCPSNVTLGLSWREGVLIVLIV